MRRTLLKYSSSLYSRHFLSPPPTFKQNPIFSLLLLTSSPPLRLFRFFSSENDSSTAPPTNIPDVDTNEFKRMINEYYDKGNEETIPLIMEAILARKLSGKHDETDDELIDELPAPPLDDITDKEFESDG